MWWLILSLTWVLAAASKWSSEAIASYSTYFHVMGWVIPGIQTILVMVNLQYFSTLRFYCRRLTLLTVIQCLVCATLETRMTLPYARSFWLLSLCISLSESSFWPLAL